MPHRKLMPQVTDKLADTATGVAVGSGGISIATLPVNQLLSGVAAIVAIISGILAGLYHWERRQYVRMLRQQLNSKDELGPGDSLPIDDKRDDPDG